MKLYNFLERKVYSASRIKPKAINIKERISTKILSATFFTSSQ